MKNYKNLFFKQSYEDSLRSYELSLKNRKHSYWDYIVLTASNESQAQIYRAQIDERLKNNELPKQTTYLVTPDPDGLRVGSGGATLNVIKKIAEIEGDDNFDRLKILILHSGGDSKRIPQYSACGKIFSPVPRCLPNGRRSTVFDEFIISFTDVPERIPAGILVASGDVLLLFNPLQIDFCFEGAAAITFKEPAERGSHHGVFLPDNGSVVGEFLHKRSVETLKEKGAVDSYGNVSIDTGAIIFDYHIVKDLYNIIRDEDGYNKFINKKVRLNFYGDFLFPMASQTDFDSYLKETPENEYSDELTYCRTVLWEKLHKYNIRLLNLAPASFIHLGTTVDIMDFYNNEIQNYEFLNWSKNVNTNVSDVNYSAGNSYICEGAVIGENAYIEDSYIGKGCRIGKNSVISCVKTDNIVVPDNVVLHGLKLSNGKFTVRMYGVNDNPKEKKLFGKPINDYLWDYKGFPVCDTVQQACEKVLSGDLEGCEIVSLKEGVEKLDGASLIQWQRKIIGYVEKSALLKNIDNGVSAREVCESMKHPMSEQTIELLLDDINSYDFSKRIRVYYYLSQILNNDDYLDACFKEIRNEITDNSRPIYYNPSLRAVKDHAEQRLPVRVNWGGGWSDTSPYCNENGGKVLNAAVCLGDELPICAYISRLDSNEIVLACDDNGSRHSFSSIDALQDLSSPFDSFAIQKAALIVFGLIPEKESVSFDSIIGRTGGFSFTTSVINIPRGSGLGTSSILACACLNALADYFDIELSEDDVCSMVMQMEQIMSTGGGWQDSLGGAVKGIKLFSSKKGINQIVNCEKIDVPEKAKAELEERFCLIFSGQRRLARNLLRTVMGRYIANEKTSLDALEKIQILAERMARALKSGNIDRFAELLNEHWELSKALDSDCTNTCIDQIFQICEDMIDGKMICGAGGGGFLQVILKKGVSKKELDEHLKSFFGYSGVMVYDSHFCWQE
ncbi:MAG: bifunctional fucokinase/L-fucose-1-P-guanylyltransferase [Clostridiales bacterium]|nr:bifunctional fucokinase/L-fucose-1-P-guanylyltransferase [Clostridiales bacterium]